MGQASIFPAMGHPFLQGNKYVNAYNGGGKKKEAQLHSFDHLGASRIEKDAVCAGAKCFLHP